MKKTYEIVKDDENGYFMLLEDGIGMAKSKSRNALVRIRAALTMQFSLIGLTVENDIDTVPTRIDGQPRGVVLAIAGNKLVVRCMGNKKDSEWPDDKLAEWPVSNCKIVEPAKISKETPADDPPNIGIAAAIALLERVVTLGDRAEIVKDAKKYLAAREAAQPAW